MMPLKKCGKTKLATALALHEPSLVYISGPISERVDNNRKVFSDAEAWLQSQGYDTVNPHKLPGIQEVATDWSACLRICIRALVDCDGIAFVGDWWRSPGAMCEFRLSTELRIERIFVPWIMQGNMEASMN